MAAPTSTVLVGDAVEQLAALPDASVHCVVTSAPYWNLRDYGVEGMIGLEPTLGEHMARLVEVFREVRRVLRADGTLWLNYGDAYSTGTNADRKPGDENPGAGDVGGWGANSQRTRRSGGLRAKQRLMLPARVALALQDDGWWIRSEIVWAKGVSFCPTYSGSCMPSSVRDRPTDSHEMLYLLTKAPRYFYDAHAVREANATPPGSPGNTTHNGRLTASMGHLEDRTWAAGGGRNLRTVWTINPKGYKEAHFATFPEGLVEPCIKAGTSERGACSDCGAPWRRVVERETVRGRSGERQVIAPAGVSRLGAIRAGWRDPANAPATVTTGWEPTCEHADAPTVPCVVLDPFSGSGTTGAVAIRLGRSYIGTELNPEYARLSLVRIGRAAAESGAGGTVTVDVDEQASQLGLFGGP